MPLRVTPQEATDAWEAGIGRAGPRIEAGVDRVTQAPGQKAAANKAGYLQGVQAMADEWARRVGAVSLEDWRASTKAAVGNVAAGATRKKQKFADRITPVFAHMNGVLNHVDGMPTQTLDQRINKSSEYQRRMAAYKKRSA